MTDADLHAAISNEWCNLSPQAIGIFWVILICAAIYPATDLARFVWRKLFRRNR